MELAEPIEHINELLKREYGVDTVTGDPIFRVVWSEDQYEKRSMMTTAEGFILLNPIVREVPKYRQYIQERFILERLVLVPDSQRSELADKKISYEPLWTFADKNLGYIPPKYVACKYIIDLVHAAQGKKSMRKYVDENEKYPKEAREERIKKLEEELFGNETAVGDALAHGYGVSLANTQKDKQ